jgi:translation elongation factor P/translation initiation factor 5A
MRFLSSPFPYANEFREGDVILYEGEECVIVERVLRDSSGVEQGGHTYYHYVNRAVLDNGVALDLRRGDRYEIIGHKEKRFI